MSNQSTQHEHDHATREWKPSRPEAATPQEGVALVEGLSDEVLLELEETSAYWVHLTANTCESRGENRRREAAGCW